MAPEKLRPVMERIAFRYHQTQQRITDAVTDLSAAQLEWRPAPEVHPIGFIVWHVARYADLLQAIIPKMTIGLAQRLEPSEQIWAAEQLAQRWGWQGFTLGNAATGKGMDDDMAAQLPLPPREELLTYFQNSFAAAAQAIDAVDDQDFLTLVDSALDLGAITVGDSLLANLVHNNQHLGEIVCLCGLQRHSVLL